MTGSSMRAFLSPGFVAAALLLGSSAVGMHHAVSGLVARYSKQGMGLLRPLQEFNTEGLPSFRLVPDGGAFDTRVSSVVGTDDAVRFVFEQKGPETEGRRDRDVLLFVTYYENPRSTIPHTPEVCYRQVGAIVNSMTTRPVTVEFPGTGPRTVRTRLLDLSIDWHAAVLYGLVCNGRVYHDRNQVRLRQGLPGDRSFYFAKVEVATNVRDGEDFAEAAERARLLFAEALKVLLADHFPSREDVG